MAGQDTVTIPSNRHVSPNYDALNSARLQLLRSQISESGFQQLFSRPIDLHTIKR